MPPARSDTYEPGIRVIIRCCEYCTVAFCGLCDEALVVLGAYQVAVEVWTAENIKIRRDLDHFCQTAVGQLVVDDQAPITGIQLFCHLGTARRRNRTGKDMSG